MTERPLSGLAPFPPAPPSSVPVVRGDEGAEELARLLMHPLLPYLVGPRPYAVQAPFQTPYYPCLLPPYVFHANSQGQPPEAPPGDANAVRRRRKARKDKERERPRSATVRLRDEDGRFVPMKQARTSTLDLQLRLDTSEGEVQKLREDLRLKEERVSALEERLRVMEEERKLRDEMLTLDPVHDIQLIRDYKMRQQYLAQLQHVAQQRFGAIHATSSPSPATTPMEQVPSSSASTPYTSPHEPMGDAMRLSGSGAADEQHMDSMSMSPPATWHFDPANQDIPKPFREKIDLSKIELRPVEPPPNLVEHARMEYYEGERQWQQQQESVQRHLSERQYGAHGPTRAPAHRMPPLPAYATKIDLNEKISQLRKTNVQQHSRHDCQPSLAESSSERQEALDPMLTDDVLDSGAGMFSDHTFFEHVLGDSAMGDELDFLSIPTPTARIWRNELERKNGSL